MHLLSVPYQFRIDASSAHLHPTPRYRQRPPRNIAAARHRATTEERGSTRIGGQVLTISYQTSAKQKRGGNIDEVFDDLSATSDVERFVIVDRIVPEHVECGVAYFVSYLIVDLTLVQGKDSWSMH